jgi:hypothetical protein
MLGRPSPLDTKTARFRASLRKIGKHVSDNKTAYIMTFIAAGSFALLHRSGVQISKFLIEEGIDPDKYWCPEYYEEKMASQK